MSSDKKICAGLLTVVFFWGTSWAASKIGLRQLSPIHLALLRFILSSVLFFILLKINYKDYTVDKKDKPLLWFLGIIGVALYFYIQHTGLNHTTTVNSSIIMGTSPIFTMFLSTTLFNQEKLTLNKIFGAIIAFMGVFLVFTDGKGISIGGSTLLGDLLILTNSICWAFFTVLGKNLVDKYDPFVVIAHIYIYATITMLPLTFITNFFSSIRNISFNTWIAALYLAIFCSVYGFYMWYKGIKILGAPRTAMFNYINPVVAVTVGIFFLKETWSIYTIIGGMLVFIGVYLASTTKSLTQIDKSRDTSIPQNKQ